MQGYSIGESTPRLTREEIVTLSEAVAGGDIDARDTLVRANLALVVHIAKKYARDSQGLADLCQIGVCGLIAGVETFDHSLGCKLSHHLGYWIRQSIRREITNHGHAIPVPAWACKAIRKFDEARESLSVGGFVPTFREVADHLDLQPKARTALQKALLARTCRAMGDSQADVPGRDDEDSIPSATPMVEALLLRLDPMERMVIRFRYGLGEQGVRSLGDVAKAYGMTREGVRQVEIRAIAKLKEMAK